MVSIASLLGARHLGKVVKNKPASSLVVSLGKALNGTPHLYVEDRWPEMATPKRVRTYHPKHSDTSLFREWRINMANKNFFLFQSRITTNVLVILGLTDLYNCDIIILFSLLIGWCSIENPLEQPGATTCKERSSVDFLAHSKHFKRKSKCCCRNWLKQKWSSISIWL